MARDMEPRRQPPRWKTTGARQRESRPPPQRGWGRRPESAGVAAGRHLDSWRPPQTPSWSRAVGFWPVVDDLYWKPLWETPIKGLGIFEVKAGLQQTSIVPSHVISWLLAAHTAPASPEACRCTMEEGQNLGRPQFVRSITSPCCTSLCCQTEDK